LAVVEALQDGLPVDQRSVRAGLLGTNLAGRFEVRPEAVGTWVLDVAHNPAAAQSLSRALVDQYVGGKTYGLLAVLADKDVAGMVAALADRVDHWVLCGLGGDRGLGVERLQERLSGQIPVGSDTSSYADVEQGLNALAERLNEQDRVVVLGSFLTVAAARDWLNRNPASTQTPL
jgi:dihydrofolate synthase/folylpolyglutamate synthase